MRGYFGIGAEQISKEANVGSLARSAHAFGAGFFFTVAPCVNVDAMRGSDTADSFSQMPYYQFSGADDMMLPDKCMLVGVELTDEAIELPSFRHPVRAAYILGPERGSLSPEIMEKCEHIIKIPTKFCVNVGVAGALVMYDRMLCTGRFAARPVGAGGPHAPVPPHEHGKWRKI